MEYVDSKGVHVKLLATGDIQTLPQPEVLTSSQVDWGLIWFPDSTRLVATANMPDQRPSIWLMSVLGGAPRKLRDDATAWSISSDGSFIAFTTNPGRIGDREIWLMGPNGEQARKVYETDEQSNFERVEAFGTALLVGIIFVVQKMKQDCAQVPLFAIE